MRYRDKPELQDKLAAEYVLGTLRGRARLRFQSWMREDAALRRTVTEWEQRLSPMAAAVAEIRPPQRVWKAIESRIGPSASAAVTTTAAAPAKSGFWDSLTFWRGWGLVATGCAAALLVTTAIRRPEVAPPIPIGREAKLPDEARMQPSYVAILHATDSKGDKLVFMAYAGRKSDELWVKRVALSAEPPQHSYELWGLPAKAGEPPRSLGIVPASEKGTIKLAAVADESLKDFPALAISIEPEGGSKTGLPTGPVIAKGDCFKFW